MHDHGACPPGAPVLSQCGLSLPLAGPAEMAFREDRLLRAPEPPVPRPALPLPLVPAELLGPDLSRHLLDAQARPAGRGARPAAVVFGLSPDGPRAAGGADLGR